MWVFLLFYNKIFFLYIFLTMFLFFSLTTAKVTGASSIQTHREDGCVEDNHVHYSLAKFDDLRGRADWPRSGLTNRKQERLGASQGCSAVGTRKLNRLEDQPRQNRRLRPGKRIQKERIEDTKHQTAFSCCQWPLSCRNNKKKSMATHT